MGTFRLLKTHTHTHTKCMSAHTHAHCGGRAHVRVNVIVNAMSFDRMYALTPTKISFRDLTIHITKIKVTLKLGKN